MTDPIADMLTRIRNAQRVRRLNIVLPFSKVKLNLAKILQKEGYIDSVKEEGSQAGKSINITLKYDEKGRPVIHGLKRISKPGQRIYLKKKNLPYVLNGLGIAVISTSQGLMTNKEARKRNLGGEILCIVW